MGLEGIGSAHSRVNRALDEAERRRASNAQSPDDALGIVPAPTTEGNQDILIPDAGSREPVESGTTVVARSEQTKTSMEDVENYFAVIARQMSDWIQPENEESRKELQENITFYNRLAAQVREGNVSEALAEIERRADLTHSWVETSGKVISYDPENLEKLRAMATALTDKIKNEKEEKEPEVTDEELNGYFSRILKEWEMSGSGFDSSARWLKKAMETNDYEALSYQMDTSIDVTNSNIQDVESGADDSRYIIEHIKDKLKPGESPAAYLKNELWNLRRFREYVVKKNKETGAAQTESTPDSRPDASTVSESPVIQEPESVVEGERTPKEWRERLKNLVAVAAEQVIGGERGKQLRAERLEGYLGGRSKDLQEKARGLGPLAVETIGSVARRYNKLNNLTKLAVTGALMLGVSTTAIAMPLVSGALAAALYGQRAIGAIGLGMNKRKKLDAKIAANPEHWMANKPELVKNAYAAALAGVYLAGTSFAVHEGVEFLRSLGVGEWFSGAPDTQSHHTEAPAQHAEAPSAEPEMQQPETVPPAETPAPVVPASEDASISPETESAGSLEVADANAESANLAAKEFGAEYAGQETAPEVAAQTDLSEQEWRAEYAEPVNHTSTPDWRAEHTESDFAPETTEEAPAPADTAPQAPVTEEAVAAPDTVSVDTLSATPETPTVPATEANHFVVNSHGIEVTTSEPHIYADAGKEHMFIYGGSPDQQARLIGQYFENPANANHTLYGADASNVSFRVPWHMVNGEVLPGEPVRTGGLFGFFSSFMEPPHPDEFAERIQFQPTEMPVTSINPDNIPRAEMPPIAPNPDDIPRANMPPANTGDEFSRPEMRVDKQNIPPSPEINPHPLAHIESGSVRGEFGYSSDGTVTSLNTAGIAHGEFKTLLNDNYGEVLVNRPGGNVGLARSVVENRARDIFNRTQVLDELVKRGAGGSPEASFLRKSIDSVIEQTEKMYGDVFKDMHR